MKGQYKSLPELHTDEEAEEFVANADLTEYDWSGCKRVHFEFIPKQEEIRITLPEALLKAVKSRAKEQNLSYTQYIEQVLEQATAQG